MFGAILPLIAVVADSIYLTITKAFLRRFGRFNSREFSWFLFTSVVILLGILMPFVGNFPPLPEVQWTIGWLILTVILACAHNLLFYWGIEREKISEVEPFLLFNPLAGILIASLFYSSERFWQVYIAIAIASIVLVWSHFKRHKIVFSQSLWAIVGFIVLHGLEVSVIRQLLFTYEPLTLYFIRCTLIVLGLATIIRPRPHIIKLHHLPYFGFLAVLVVISVWAAYSAFQLRGLSETLFVFTLSPILVYWLSAVFLKEKWQIRNIIASIVIVGLVVWITLLQ